MNIVRHKQTTAIAFPSAEPFDEMQLLLDEMQKSRHSRSAGNLFRTCPLDTRAVRQGGHLILSVNEKIILPGLLDHLLCLRLQWPDVP